MITTSQTTESSTPRQSQPASISGAWRVRQLLGELLKDPEIQAMQESLSPGAVRVFQTPVEFQPNADIYAASLLHLALGKTEYSILARDRASTMSFPPIDEMGPSGKFVFQQYLRMSAMPEVDFDNLKRAFLDPSNEYSNKNG